jgi:quercetin dioxygenase-like cupin family protein
MEKTPDLSNSLTVGGDQLSFRVTSEDTGGALVAVEVRMAPGGGPPLLHRHAAAEVYHVRSGEFTVYLGDVRIAAPAGSVIPIAGGREHTIRNESDAEATAYVVFAPGAAMESFVREAATASDVLEVAARHGVEMTRAVYARA